MDAVQALEFVFVLSIAVAAALIAGAAFLRISRSLLVAGVVALGGAAAVSWMVFALDPSEELALSAGGTSVAFLADE